MPKAAGLALGSCANALPTAAKEHSAPKAVRRIEISLDARISWHSR
jgi:hypothetical protein